MSRSGVRFPEAAPPLTWDTVSGEQVLVVCGIKRSADPGANCVYETE